MADFFLFVVVKGYLCSLYFFWLFHGASDIEKKFGTTGL